MSLGLGLFHRLGLGNVNPSRSRIYGVSFRDNGNGFTYYREGLAPYGVNDTIPESMLSVHNKMKRCVTGYDGKLKYYLDPTNSMFKEGSFRNIATDQDGTVTTIDRNYGAGTITLTVSPDSGKELDESQVGCYIRVYDRGEGSSHNMWYALITAINTGTNTITLSHPHLTFLNGGVYEDWGTVGNGNTCYYMIGDAKLGGQDGNVMVEIPTIYYRYSYGRYQHDGNNDYQTHEISLRPFPGARRYPKRYMSAFEGVSATYTSDKYTPYNGWSGIWDDTNKKWTNIINESTGNKIASVAGYYPKTFLSLDGFRNACKDIDAGYHQYDFTTNFIIQVLMLIEKANGNTQSTIGAGISNVTSARWSEYNGYRTIRRTGDTICFGNATGKLDDTGLNTVMSLTSADPYVPYQYPIQGLSYRGIENPYGHIFKWVDGLEFVNNVIDTDKQYLNAYAHKSIEGGDLNIAELVSHTYDTLAGNPDHTPPIPPDSHYGILKGINGDELQILTWLWQSSPDAKWVDKSRYWGQASPELLPNDSGASKTGYFYDYFYTPSSAIGNKTLRVLAVGGHAYNGVLVGAFYVHSAYGSGYTHAYYGGRLCKKS